MIKVLVACEESQIVCKAFRLFGAEAYSCDLQECSGGHPEWHIKGNAFIEAYNGRYDLMIAHPPCTYLSKAGARWLYPSGIFNAERYEKGLYAKAFFEGLFNAPIKYIAIENPLPQEVYKMPKYSQIIQPYQFGHEVQKATCLWLKNLPYLTYTKIVSKGEFVRFPATGHRHSKWFMGNNAKNRSKTFNGIAMAMAEQWVKYVSTEIRKGDNAKSLLFNPDNTLLA